jgi:gliding motility-associated-like protein
MGRFVRALFSIGYMVLLCSSANGQLNANFTSNIVTGCAPILVQFTNQSTGNPTSYLWDLGNGTTSNVQNPSTTYITPGTYTVSLIVTDGTTFDTSAIVNYITVVPTPVVNFVASDSSISCPLKTVSFTDNSSLGNSGIGTYFWDFGDGNSSTQQNPTHTYNTVGNYSVTLSVTNSAGCSNNLTKGNYIQLVQKPTAGFTATNSNSCTLPLSVNFTNTSSNAISYAWNFGNNTTSTSQNPTCSYSSTGSYTVRLIATNAAGCKDTMLMPAFVNIGSLSASFTKSTATTCTNNTVVFTNTSLPGPGISTWYFGDGSSSVGINAAHAYSTTGTYTVKLVVNYNNCSDSTTQTVTVTQGPSSQFTATPTSGCSVPFTTQFANTSTGGVGYLWIFGDGTTSTLANPSHTYNTLGVYTVTLVTYGPNGCNDSLIKPNYINVTAPTMNISISNPVTCGAPANVTFTTSTNSVFPVTSYLWNFGDGSPVLPITGTATHLYNTSGTYTVTLTYTTNPGCTFTKSVTLNIGSLPNASFVVSNATPCPNQSVTFTNASTGPSGTTYLWYFGDGGISTAVNSTHAYTIPGPYTVSLVANNYGCKDTFTSVINVNPPQAQFTPVYDCANRTQVSFNNTSTGGTSWLWNFGNGNNSTAQAPVYNYPVFGTFTVILTATNSTSGCTSTHSVPVILFDLEAKFIAADSNTCKAKPVIFSAQSSPYYNSYIWNFGDGSPNQTTTTATVSHTYANVGTYTVSLIVKDIRNCYDTLVKTNYVQVNALPTANFTGGPVTGCAPLLVNFTDQSTAGGGAITSRLWKWGDGSTTTGNLTTPGHAYNAGTFNVTLKLTDINGCVDSVVKPNYLTASRPVAAFTSTDTNKCAGQTVNFINNSTGTALTYNWSFGDGGTSTAANPSHIYTAPGNYTVRLITTGGALQCIDTLVKTNYIHIIGVNLGFTASDTFASCPPLSVNLINTSVAASNFNWSFGNNNNSTLNSPNTIYTYPGVYTIKLKGQNVLGCPDSVTKTITVLGPTGTLSYTPINGCDSVVVQFSSTNTAQMLIWDLNNGVTQMTTASTLSYTYNNPGRYVPKLLLSDGNSCIVPVIGVDTIKVDSVNGDFTFNPGQVCTEGLIQFYDTTYYSVNAITTRYWNFGDGGTSTLPNPSHFYTAPGSYTVTFVLTTSQGCTDTVLKTVNILQAPSVSAGTGVAICMGNVTPVQLQATGAQNYLWSANPGLSCSNCANPLVNPSASTTYTVVGTAVNGCMDTAQVTVTVNPLPIINAGANQVICAGDTLQLNVTGASSYVWMPGTDLSCNTCSNPLAYPLTSNTYTIAGVDTNGCSNSTQLTITVNSVPALTASADQSICSGSSAQLQVSGAAAYSWTPSTGLSCATCSNPVANPSTTTAYTVTGSTTNGCSSKDTITITVNSLPQLVANQNQAICYGDTLQLAVSGAATYTWSPSSTLSCGNCDTTLAFPLATTTYSALGTDTNGCVNTAQVTVTVNPLPMIAILPDVTICEGTSVQLAVSGTQTYSWSPVLTLSCSTCTSPVATPDTTTIYHVIGYSAAGCSTSGDIAVTVLPKPEVLIAASTNVICDGDTASFTASGAVSYNWLPSAGLSCAACPSVLASPSSSTTYIITGTASNGCLDTAQVSLTVNSRPSVSAGSNVSICLGDTAQLIATGAVNYTWSPGTGLTCATCDTTFSIITSTASYTVIGTDTNGCSNSSTVIVTVNQPPVITVSPDTTICEGLSASLFVSGASGYNWTPSASLNCSSCTNPFASPIISTVYSVIGTDNNGCVDSASVTVNVNAKPVVNAGADQSSCRLNSVQLQATGALSYTWSPASTLSCSICPDPIASPSGTTTYTVTGIDTNGCANTDDVVVTLFPQPIINAGPDQSLCSDKTLQLMATGGMDYLWTAPDSSLSCYNCPDPIASPANNVTYKVIGTDINGCRDSDLVNITVIHLQPFVIGPGDTICYGESTYLFASGGDEYTWSPYMTLDDNKSSNPKATPPETMTYTVVIKQGSCFSDTGHITITVIPLPIINTGADINTVAGTAVNLHANATGVTAFEWSPGESLSCIDCSDPVATPKVNTTYHLHVKNEFGCVADDDVTVFVTCENGQIFMPNTFTPNGDGNNDRFYPQGKGIQTIRKFTIFNRWGEVVFESLNMPLNNEFAGWDGRKDDQFYKPDVFIYIIDAICDTGEPMLLRGDISLIR